MRVRLPLAVGTGTTSTPYASPDPVPASKLVLVVDDEAAIRLSISRFLARRGYRVHVAGDGLEALEVLADLDWRVDLVLTDIVMPRLGGIELSERIVSRPSPPAVLCMTGHAGRASEPPADAPWHPDQVLVKPFELGQLVERIAAKLAVSGG